jgi:hypothetical protein
MRPISWSSWIDGERSADAKNGRQPGVQAFRPDGDSQEPDDQQDNDSSDKVVEATEDVQLRDVHASGRRAASITPV